MAVAEKYIVDEARSRQIKRRSRVQGFAIALTGFILPPVLMGSVWLTFTVLDVMPLARSRLTVMLTPNLQELLETFFVLTLFALPYIVQGINAARKLAQRGKKRQRAEWRIGGCFVGLVLATVAVFLFVVPFDATWVNPGFGAPMRILLIYYVVAVILGAFGGLFGYDVGRKFFVKRRTSGGRA